MKSEGRPGSSESSRSGESQTQTHGTGSGSENGGSENGGSVNGSGRSEEENISPSKTHTNFSIDNLLHRKMSAALLGGERTAFPVFPPFHHPYLAQLIHQHRQAALFARAWPHLPSTLYPGVGGSGEGAALTSLGMSSVGSAVNEARSRPVLPGKNPPVKKYKCDMCGKAFSRSNTLITHKRIHTGEKPFKCEHCGRAFRQPGNLTRHRLTHTTVKPYICAQCGKAFNRASNLHTHMRTHSSYRPFVCPYCAKGFHQKIDMKIHVYTHTQPGRDGQVS